MRYLCKKDCDKPIPSLPKIVDSTSADIHAYIGTFPTQKHPSTSLLFDCEGISGGFPVAKKHQLRSSDDEAHLLDIRKPYVKTAFPRLLYMVSSVLVFVFSGAIKEIQTWITDISEYGNRAAAATVNHHTLPYLVVIFNPVVSEGEWDIEKSSASVEHIRQFKQLSTLFSGVKIISINAYIFSIRLSLIICIYPRSQDTRLHFCKSDKRTKVHYC